MLTGRLWPLWTLVVVDAVGMLLPLPLPDFAVIVLTLIAEVLFAVLHGARSYGWRGIAVFAAATLVISNGLENLSVATGVPFGHYHYTDELGPKLFSVPVLIGPAYLAVGYLAWRVGTALLGDVRRGSGWLLTIGTPVVASFVMVAWDLALDPTSATLHGRWVWADGGGFFGVPLSNFLGWSLTVYLFYQTFALYQRFYGTVPTDTGRGFLLLPAISFAVQALYYVVTYATGGFHEVPAEVTDATGHAWRSADVYESTALLAIYSMLFFALLAALRILQTDRSLDATSVR